MSNFMKDISIFSLDDDMLIEICQYLKINEAQILSFVSKLFRTHCTSDNLWEFFCKCHWLTKESKYFLTDERKKELLNVYPGSSWLEIYNLVEDDGLRTYFESDEELSALTFDYRYRCEPDKCMSLCFRFNPNHHVSGHPNHLTYEWKLLEKGRKVTLGLFPPAKVRRLKTWGWALINPNIVCISLDEGSEHQTEQVVSRYPEFFNPNDRIRGPSAAVRALLATLQQENQEGGIGAGMTDDLMHGPQTSSPGTHFSSNSTSSSDSSSSSSSSSSSISSSSSSNIGNGDGGGGGGGGVRHLRNENDFDNVFASSTGIFYGIPENTEENNN